MNRIKLKGRDSKILGRLTQSSNGINGNGNGNGAAPVAKKKKTTTKKTAKAEEEPEMVSTVPVASVGGDKIIESPVKVRVFRTVKKRNKDGNEENSSGEQENPDQKPGEPGDDPDWETIEVRKFVTEPARVRFHFDIGRNVHFQSASAGISVEIPCYVEEIPDACVEAKAICLDRMRPEVKELDKVLDYLVKQRVKKDKDLRDKGIA